MESLELQPVTQPSVDALFLPQLLQADLREFAKEKSKETRSPNSKPAGGRRSGQKALLAAKDFILPELVKHADNGDLSVSVASSSDSAHVDQVFRLAECGEEVLPSFSALSCSEQQLEKRRY